MWRVTDSGIVGECTRCEREFPAIGLVPVDQMVPNRDGTMRHIIGWFCGGCRPRDFGKMNGKPSMGIVMAPCDGSHINPPKQRGLRPMGTLDDIGRLGRTITSRKRARKMQPMKAL